MIASGENQFSFNNEIELTEIIKAKQVEAKEKEKPAQGKGQRTLSMMKLDLKTKVLGDLIQQSKLVSPRESLR